MCTHGWVHAYMHAHVREVHECTLRPLSLNTHIHTHIHALAGYLNLAMIILGVHFSHACVDVLSTLWSFGIQVSPVSQRAQESYILSRK